MISDWEVWPSLIPKRREKRSASFRVKRQADAGAGEVGQVAVGTPGDGGVQVVAKDGGHIVGR